MDDEIKEIKRATEAVLEAVHDVTDRLLPPEVGSAVLLGIAAVVIAENLKPGQEPDETRINEIWAERGFPFRMTRWLQ